MIPIADDCEMPHGRCVWREPVDLRKLSRQSPTRMGIMLTWRDAVFDETPHRGETARAASRSCLLGVVCSGTNAAK